MKAYATLTPGKCHHCGDPTELSQRTGQPYTRCVAHRSYLRGRTSTKAPAKTAAFGPTMTPKAQAYKRQPAESSWWVGATRDEFYQRVREQQERINNNSREFPMPRVSDGIESSWR